MKPDTVSIIESVGCSFATAGMCLAFWMNLPLAQQPIWLLAMSSLSVYSSLRLIKHGKLAESQFRFIFPLTICTIWQYFTYHDIDLSPLLYMTGAFAFFSMTFRNASISAGLLLCIAFSASQGGFATKGFVVWLGIVFSTWALLTWLHSHEKESIKTQFNNMKQLVKGFMTQSHEPVTLDHLPELDSDSMFVKSAANEFRLESLMDKITEIIQSVMNCHSCYFFCLDREENNLKVQACQTKSRFFERNAIIDVNSSSILSWVVRRKQKIRHERLPKELQYPDYYNPRERILACVVHPIVINGNVEGLLGIDGKMSYSFGVYEEQVMALFAKLAEELLEAFRRYQSRDMHADYMAAFYQAVRKIIQDRLDLKSRIETLIELCNMMKKCDEIAVAVPREDGAVIVRDAKGDNARKLIGAVIHETSVCAQMLQSKNDLLILSQNELLPDRRDLFFPGEQRFGLNSMMIVALPMQKELPGILFLGARKRDYFDDNDRFVFSTLAVQFGIALENAINLEKIQKLAITDGLTNAYNHRYFQDSLQNEINRAKREPTTFSLLLMDIDHFKRFNDTYGHQAGDEVLKSLVMLLKEQAREIDTVARYGGEEFVVILRQCDLKMAAKTAERIRKTCDRLKIKIGEETLNVTISVGVANFPVHATESAELVAVADDALYRAKELGRNRIEIASTDDQ